MDTAARRVLGGGDGYKMSYNLKYYWIALRQAISYYKIKNGNFDTISACKYSVPSFLDIGKLYSIMIEDCAKPGNEVQELINIFNSFISDEISNFNSDLYYQNPDYLEWSYREGHLLD